MITTKVTSNIDAVIAEARRALSQNEGPSEHILEVRNTADYAVYVHDREGYYVLNDEALEAAAQHAVADRLAVRGQRGEMLTDTDMVEALGEAADVVVEFYQEVVGTTDQPGRRKRPPRPVHSGGFASDTERLISSYERQVDDGDVKKYPNPL